MSWTSVTKRIQWFGSNVKWICMWFCGDRKIVPFAVAAPAATVHARVSIIRVNWFCIFYTLHEDSFFSYIPILTTPSCSTQFIFQPSTSYSAGHISIEKYTTQHSVEAFPPFFIVHQTNKWGVRMRSRSMTIKMSNKKFDKCWFHFITSILWSLLWFAGAMVINEKKCWRKNRCVMVCFGRALPIN